MSNWEDTGWGADYSGPEKPWLQLIVILWTCNTRALEKIKHNASIQTLFEPEMVFLPNYHYFLMVQIRINPCWQTGLKQGRSSFQHCSVSDPDLCGGSNQRRRISPLGISQTPQKLSLCNKQYRTFYFSSAIRESSVLFFFSSIQCALGFCINAVLLFLSMALVPLDLTVPSYARQGSNINMSAPENQARVEEANWDLLTAESSWYYYSEAF